MFKLTRFDAGMRNQEEEKPDPYHTESGVKEHPVHRKNHQKETDGGEDDARLLEFVVGVVATLGAFIGRCIYCRAAVGTHVNAVGHKCQYDVGA